MRGMAFTFAAVLAFCGTVFAHGAHLSWTARGDSIEVRAEFDDGSPMAGAQVAVFSTEDPVNPCMTGETDVSGCFAFLPDGDSVEAWDVQVRLAGHGGMVRVYRTSATADTGEEGAPGSGSDRFTTLQLLVMAVCVVWGLTGTALYFRSRSRGADGGDDAHT
jgi:nickel transport protein